jgi:hypothetical protein
VRGLAKRPDFRLSHRLDFVKIAAGPGSEGPGSPSNLHFDCRLRLMDLRAR